MDDNKNNNEINKPEETVTPPETQQNPESQVRYYSPQVNHKPPQGKLGTMKKPLIILGGIIIALIIFGVACDHATSNLLGTNKTHDEYGDVSGKHIGVLYVEGTITSEDSSSMLASGTVYDHQWTLDSIDEAINNPDNEGLIVFVNTPGGGVYESDELYLKLKEYKKTGRPLYAAMGSMAASGGYYISAPADKIIANRNCWTGSIGVTIGTLYDISGLLDKYGVKTVTITSGANKAMGSMVDPLSKEQKAIFQGLVDEAYDQFVDVVKEGRKMPEKKVRKLADGRIYTAKQAVNNGLIDQVGTLDEAIDDMKSTHNLEDCEVVDIEYYADESLFDSLFMMFSDAKKGTDGDVSSLLQLMEKQGEVPITYMSEVRK